MTHNRFTLAAVLGLDPDSSEFKTTVGELVYSGFLESSGDQFNVPFLYRPGAGVVQGSAISS